MMTKQKIQVGKYILEIDSYKHNDYEFEINGIVKYNGGTYNAQVLGSLKELDQDILCPNNWKDYEIWL